VEISNRFAALENSDESPDVNSASVQRKFQLPENSYKLPFKFTAIQQSGTERIKIIKQGIK
jgi:hypothetical protein